MYRAVISTTIVSSLFSAAGAATVWAIDGVRATGDAAAQARLDELLRERVVDAEKAVHAAEHGYHAGVLEEVDVLDAIDGLAIARLAVATTEKQELRAADRGPARR